MVRVLLISLITVCSLSMSAQITINQTDMGQAGDSMIVGNDSPTSNVSVGGTGNQTWNFTFSVDNINTLKFEYLSNTASGSYFPNSNLAIQRQTDTLFFKSSTSSFELDGITGDGFNLGVSLRIDFDPNATLITFPSTFGTTFVDTAVFDTIVDCDAFGQGSVCDSAHLKRTMIITSDFDAWGQLNTSGGSYNTIRQYLIQDSQDRLWIKLPFIGWQSTPFYSSDSTEYSYRWYANNEKWPVLSAVADAPGGNIVSAEFQIDDLLGYSPYQSNPLCHNSCDGSATAQGLGANPPYTYQWPASANNQTTATATGLCAGTYMVTIHDNDTNTSVLEISLVNPTKIQISGSVQGVSMGNDGAIDITASGGAGNFTYAWTGPDGFTATTADISGIGVGEYTVAVTDGNGCDTTRTFLVDLTIVNEISDGDIRIFPNPAGSTINVVTPAAIEQVQIVDLLGNIVYKQTQTGETVLQISTNPLSSGLYMVEVMTNNGRYLRKITVRK